MKVTQGQSTHEKYRENKRNLLRTMSTLMLMSMGEDLITITLHLMTTHAESVAPASQFELARGIYITELHCTKSINLEAKVWKP